MLFMQERLYLRENIIYGYRLFVFRWSCADGLCSGIYAGNLSV